MTATVLSRWCPGTEERGRQGGCLLLHAPGTAGIRFLRVSWGHFSESLTLAHKGCTQGPLPLWPEAPESRGESKKGLHVRSSHRGNPKAESRESARAPGRRAPPEPESDSNSRWEGSRCLCGGDALGLV